MGKSSQTDYEGRQDQRTVPDECCKGQTCFPRRPMDDVAEVISSGRGQSLLQIQMFACKAGILEWNISLHRTLLFATVYFSYSTTSLLVWTDLGLTDICLTHRRISFYSLVKVRGRRWWR